MKYYVIAGEASGDLHGGNLLKALAAQDSRAEFRCWGGDHMQAAGGHLVKHYRDLAFMGFAEVLMNLRTILANIRFCKADILAHRPDALILIDYPGFNLRIAKWAKAQGIRVIYYISPQVWAWKEGRVKMMKQCIDQMLVILPFEKDYYQQKWQWQVHYVGHPLVEAVDGYQPRIGSLSDRPIVALLPGSRRQEIKANLPVMLAASRHFPDYQFIVAMAPGMEESFYKPFLAGYANVSAVGGLTYDLLRQARAAMVTSGTATLETALFGVPEVVCYKGNPISYAIARRLITIKYISLVNLIMDRPILTELIQHDLQVEKLVTALRPLLQDEATRSAMAAHYASLRQLLAGGGHASVNAARLISSFLATKN